MAKVFISYRQVAPDLAIARSLYYRLRELEHDVFFDREHIKPGAQWDAEIQAHLRETEWFVPIISSTYFHSEYIAKEMRLAEEMRRSGALQGILPINVAFDGIPSTEDGRAVAALQAIKWRSEEDTSTVVEAVAQQIPSPLILVKGMRPFEVTDAEAFLKLGRQAELETFLAQVSARPSPLLLIHGTSGSGKTSFLRAGVMARLLKDGVPVRLLREPFPPTWEQLAPKGEKVVLIDQFEQLLAHLGRHPEECGTFKAGLAQSLQERPDTTWVLCLRDEYRTAFETVLPSWSRRTTRFPLLSFTPSAAARVLGGLLESAQVEHTPAFLKALCQELAEDTPPTVKPALLQLIAQRCRDQKRTLDQAHWERLRAGSGSLFEVHVRESVLSRLRGPVRRRNAARVLRTLTAGELKSTPRLLAEAAREAAVSEATARSVLESAADSRARIVNVEVDAEAQTSYQLVHDLFAGAIERVHRDEARRWELWGRSALAVVLGGLLLLTLGLWSQAVEQKQLAEKGRQEAEAMSRRVLAGKLTAQARSLLDTEPQRALLLLLEALRVTSAPDEQGTPEAEQELRGALSRIGGTSLRLRASRKIQQLSVGRHWLAVAFARGAAMCRLGVAQQERDCQLMEVDTYDFVGVGPADRWLITRGTSSGLKLWALNAEGKASASTVELTPSQPGQPLVLSDDRERLVFSGSDGRLRTVDLSMLEPVEQVLVQGAQSPVEALGLSSDGRWLAASVKAKGPAESSRIQVWDLDARTSAPRLSFTPGTQAKVETVSISGDGRWLVTWGRQVQGSETAPAYNQLWDLRNAAKPLPARSPAPGELGSIPAVFSLDSQWLAASGFATGSVRLFSLVPEVTRAEPLQLSGSGNVEELRFTADGAWLIGRPKGLALTLQAWFLEPLRVSNPEASRVWSMTLRGHELPISGLALGEGGQWLVSHAQESELRMWPLSGPTPGVQPLPLGKALSASTGASAWPREPQGRWLLTTHTTPLLWDLDHLDADGPFQVSLSPEPRWQTVRPSPDDRWLVGEGHDGWLQVLFLEGGRDWQRLQEGDLQRSSFSPDGRWLMAVSSLQPPRFWELRDGSAREHTWTLPAPEAEVTGFAFVPGGEEVLLLRGGRLLRLVLAGSEAGHVTPLDCDGHSIEELVSSPDGRWALGRVSSPGISDDGAGVQACVWSLAGLAGVPRRLRGISALRGVAFTPDSRGLVTLSQTARSAAQAPMGNIDMVRHRADLRYWPLSRVDLDAVHVRQVLMPPLPEGEPWSPSFSADGEWLYLSRCGALKDDLDWMGAQRGCLVPVHAPSQQPPTPILFGGTGHFSVDGKWFAAMSTRIEVWELLPHSTAQERGSLRAPRKKDLTVMAFSQDGRWIAASDSQSIWLWPLKPGAATGEPVVVQAHAEVLELHFTRDSRWLLSTEREKTSSEVTAVQVWASPVGGDMLRELTRRAVGRNMRFGEWIDAMGEAPYQKTFEAFPTDEEQVSYELSNAQFFSRQGYTDAARERYERMVALALELRDNGNIFPACIIGSLDGFASTVMPICEMLVSLNPDDLSMRLPRGIARAQLGDYAGAIEDLRAHIQSIQETGREGLWGSQVYGWVDALSAGRNPFVSLTFDKIMEPGMRALFSTDAGAAGAALPQP
jgi:WD40 repeat protein